MARTPHLAGLDINADAVPSDVSTTPLPDESVPTSAETFGAGVAQARQASLHGLDQTSNIFFNMAHEQATADAKNAHTDFSGWIDQKDADFREKNQGFLAKDALPSYQADIQKEIQQRASTLPLHLQDGFRNMANATAMQSYGSNVNWSAKQHEGAVDSSDQASIGEFMRKAVVNKDNPQSVEDNLKGAEFGARDFLKRKGMDAATIDEKVKSIRGQAVANLAKAYIDERQYDKVAPLLDANRDKIDDKSLLAVSSAWKGVESHALAADEFQKAKSPVFSEDNLDDYLNRTHAIEKPAGSRNVSPTGARGDFQFINSTAKRMAAKYGDFDPDDPAQSRVMAGHLAVENSRYLRKSLGRDPLGSEVYLAHQQGAGGAAALIAHPEENAVDALVNHAGLSRDDATRNIVVNGGSASMTAGQFAQKWSSVYDSKGGISSYRVAANNVSQRDDLDPFIKADAISKLNALHTAAKGEQDELLSGYWRNIVDGKTDGLAEQIKSDPRLDYSQRTHLYAILQKQLGEDDGKAYGKGYSELYARTFLPSNDPRHIDGADEILQRAGPGGDLTETGATRLLKMQKDRREGSPRSTYTASFSDIMGQVERDMGADTKNDDKEAQSVYHYKVRPQIEEEFDAVMTKGTPAERAKFMRELPQHANAIVNQLDTPEQRASRKMDTLIKQANANKEAAEIAASASIPKDTEFARVGIKPENWTQAVALPRPSGLSAENWAKVLRRVSISPTSDNAEQLDAAFRKPGAGKFILETLGVKMVQKPKATEQQIGATP